MVKFFYFNKWLSRLKSRTYDKLTLTFRSKLDFQEKVPTREQRALAGGDCIMPP